VESKNATSIKTKLLKFYIANKVTVTGLTNLIKELNMFLTSSELAPPEDLDLDSSVDIIPKIEFDTSIQLKREEPQREGAAPESL
jgi:hypothetical protein